MIFTFFLASMILTCLPPLQTMPVCPESFSCPDIGQLKYPFYNTTDPKCGLIKVNCTSNHKTIQFGGRSYDIFEKLGPRFIIRDAAFEELIENKRCEALMNNFTSPTPFLFLIQVFPVMTLFKCSNNRDYDSYFDHEPDYKSYSSCKPHKFYYNKYPTIDTSVPRDLPATCEVIQLPLNLRRPEIDDLANGANIFSYITSNFSISFYPPSCATCSKEGWDQCSYDDQKFMCRDDKKDNRKRLLILVLSGLFGFILMLSSVIFVIRYQHKRNTFSYVSSKEKTPDLEDKSFFYGVSVFSYAELKDATRNFDPSQELGVGGFGAVYYGKLQDGQEVAVKRLYENNYKRVQQFMNEIEILTRLRHPNLVVLYGCSSRQCNELLLVYEYISNGTVAEHLHGKRANPSFLTWPLRMNIAIETASALVYLHASEIIHRDVKTSNILLDHNFSVKVADFGLSRPLPNDVTHVSTAPQGTPGYLDPQYHQCYRLTDKSDVYSFGVVLIELISSMVAIDLSRSQDNISLANLAINRIQRCAIHELIDPDLGSDTDAEIVRMVTSVAELAFRCLQYDSEMRPAMNEVLDVLKEIQAEGRPDAHKSINELKTIRAPPPSENLDAVVMLKDFMRSPASVASEWQSDSCGSTPLNISENGLPTKNHSSI